MLILTFFILYKHNKFTRVALQTLKNLFRIAENSLFGIAMGDATIFSIIKIKKSRQYLGSLGSS